jgi:hypothetical protein
MTEPYDGITEVWVGRSRISPAKETTRSENTGPALLEDESKFIDFERWSVFLPEKYSV